MNKDRMVDCERLLIIGGGFATAMRAEALMPEIDITLVRKACDSSCRVCRVGVKAHLDPAKQRGLETGTCGIRTNEYLLETSAPDISTLVDCRRAL